MAKKVNKRKRQDIIINSLQNCFQEFDVPLEVRHKTKELIVLDSPALIGAMNFYVIVDIQRKAKIVRITVAREKKIEKPHFGPLIELTNMINKIYSSVGFLIVDTENRCMNMRFAVELIDERLDINHLKICLSSLLVQVTHFLGFVESANIVNSTTARDLKMQYIAYSKGVPGAEFRSYL
jgi:hypothetical protein